MRDIIELAISVLCAVLLFFGTGCGKSGEDSEAAAKVPSSPKEAASQLQQVFVTATPEVKQTVETASEALRGADYEKAVQSLQAIQARQNLTFEQGMTVYNSMVALEQKLIAAAAAGDANAKRAYEQLKQSRRH